MAFPLPQQNLRCKGVLVARMGTYSVSKLKLRVVSELGNSRASSVLAEETLEINGKYERK
jgi:hypothetical protein